MSKNSVGQQAWDEVCKLRGEIIALRARVDALEGHRPAVPMYVCPRCKGNGEIEIGRGNGVRAVVSRVPCPTCGGLGGVSGEPMPSRGASRETWSND